MDHVIKYDPVVVSCNVDLACSFFFPGSNVATVLGYVSGLRFGYCAFFPGCDRDVMLVFIFLWLLNRFCLCFFRVAIWILCLAFFRVTMWILCLALFPACDMEFCVHFFPGWDYGYCDRFFPGCNMDTVPTFSELQYYRNIVFAFFRIEIWTLFYFSLVHDLFMNKIIEPLEPLTITKSIFRFITLSTVSIYLSVYTLLLV